MLISASQKQSTSCLSLCYPLLWLSHNFSLIYEYFIKCRNLPSVPIIKEKKLLLTFLKRLHHPWTNQHYYDLNCSYSYSILYKNKHSIRQIHWMKCYTDVFHLFAFLTLNCLKPENKTFGFSFLGQWLLFFVAISLVWILFKINVITLLCGISFVVRHWWVT